MTDPTQSDPSKNGGFLKKVGHRLVIPAALAAAGTCATVSAVEQHRDDLGNMSPTQASDAMIYRVAQSKTFKDSTLKEMAPDLIQAVLQQLQNSADGNNISPKIARRIIETFNTTPEAVGQITQAFDKQKTEVAHLSSSELKTAYDDCKKEVFLVRFRPWKSYTEQSVPLPEQSR